GVVLALRRCGQAQLHRRREVLEDVTPCALVVRAAAMALIDDDEIEEVGRVLAEIGRRLAVLRRPGHERLKDREEDAAVGRHPALLSNRFRRYAYERVFFECGEGVVRLIGKRVAISKEQDAWSALWRLSGFPVLEIPATMKQFPRDLKSDEGLARASCERQQDPIATVRDRFEHTHDCGVLIVAPLEEAALVLKRHSGEPIAPCVRFREREIPQLVRRREARLLTLASRLHIDAIHTTTVRREGMTDRELG